MGKRLACFRSSIDEKCLYSREQTAGRTDIAMRAMRRLAGVAIALALAAGLAAPVYAIECDGIALPDGCLFTITGGDTPYPDDGFAVTNADSVPMWDFVQEQDLQAIGYPISQRWSDGPFTLQAFQKVILQWDPGRQRVNWYNTLDVLADKHANVELPNVPAHQVLEADQGVTSFGVIIRNHLALLDANPKIKAAFLAEPNWLNLYGLPIAYEEREVDGNPQGLQVLRAQRTVFAIWNVPAPGTTVGSVVLQNVPDKIKRLINVIIPDIAKAPAAPIQEAHLDNYFASAMRTIATVSQSGFANLSSQPWFPDHITDREKAWIVGLLYFSDYTSYERPIEEYFIGTRTISLDNAREINIWIIKETPFNPEDRLLDRIDQFMRISEEFLGVPFPTNDIIFTVTGDYNYIGFGTYGAHLNSYFILHESFLGSLEHEMSHYYFNSSFGNRWQVEGGADFMSAYVNDRTGRESIADLRPRVFERVQENCLSQPGVTTLHELTDYQTRSGNIGSCSPYDFGNLFLLDVLAIVGESAMGRSLGEIYHSGFGFPATDEELYRIILRNAPEESREALRALYRRLHGAPFTASPSATEPVAVSIHEAVAPVLMEILPWAANPPDIHHADALRALVSLWWIDNGLMIRVAKFDWIVDGVNHNESAAINYIRRIAAMDTELGELAAGFRWIVDDMKPWEETALSDLWLMVERNRDASSIVMHYPWMQDILTSEEGSALLQFRAVIQTEHWRPVEEQGIAEILVTLPWIADGLSRSDAEALRLLEAIAAHGKDYFTHAMSVPWIADGIASGEESAALDYLPTLAAIDLGFAKAVLALAWTADGWDHRERQALGRISSIFNPNQSDFRDPNRVIYLDSGLALQLVSFPWFRDGINGHELSALGELRGVVVEDVALGGRILGLGWFRDDITEVESRAVHHLHRITLHNVHLARQVLNYSWVADGITESEVASLASMAP